MTFDPEVLRRWLEKGVDAIKTGDTMLLAKLLEEGRERAAQWESVDMKKLVAEVVQKTGRQAFIEDYLDAAGFKPGKLAVVPATPERRMLAVGRKAPGAPWAVKVSEEEE